MCLFLVREMGVESRCLCGGGQWCWWFFLVVGFLLEVYGGDEGECVQVVSNVGWDNQYEGGDEQYQYLYWVGFVVQEMQGGGVEGDQVDKGEENYWNCFGQWKVVELVVGNQQQLWVKEYYVGEQGGLQFVLKGLYVGFYWVVV